MIGKVTTNAPCELFGAVWAEMRGYGGYVYTAVAWSIRNRADKWYGGDYHATVWARHQYSFTDETAPHDPNLRAYNAAVSGKVKGAEFAEMVESVEKVYNGTTSDPTGGATHYLSPMTRGWDRLWPTWAWGDRSRISLDYGQVAQFFVCKPEHPRC